MGFKFNPSNFINDIDYFYDKSQYAVLTYCNTAAKKLEGTARENRPWTDRSGRARQGLTGYVNQKNDTVYRINLAHTVNYGLWLELAHEKKYAILEPTIRLKGPDVTNGLYHLLERLKM